MSLNLEQQFELRKVQAKIKDLSREDLEAAFVQLIRDKMLQENQMKMQMMGSLPGIEGQCHGR